MIITICWRMCGGKSSKGPTAIDLLLLIFISCSVDDLPMAANLLFAPDASARLCLGIGWLCPPWNKWLPTEDWCMDAGPLDEMLGGIAWCGSDGCAMEGGKCGFWGCLAPCSPLFRGWSGHRAGTIASRKSIMLFWRGGILLPMPAFMNSSWCLK